MKLPTVLNMKQKKAMTAGSVALLVGLGVLVADENMSSLRGNNAPGIRRGLSIDLGDGDCEWAEPITEVPDELDLWKTLLVGFPSGDKRMAYVQMEALSGLPSKDDWDFVFNGYSNAPFIKTNYPNAAGIWSWNSEADQVALVIQYIRRSLVEFSDVLWYMSFEDDYNKDRVKVEELYGQRHDINDFYAWRDQYVLLEIYKYGWYIDYWMDNGLYRDPYTHHIVDQDWWELYRSTTVPKIGEEFVSVCHRTTSEKNPMVTIHVSTERLQEYLDHGDYLGHCDYSKEHPTFSIQNYTIDDGQAVRDPKCDQITGTCRPVQVISADKLRESSDETEIIGNILMKNKKIARHIINKEAWPCIWDKLMNEDVGPVTFKDRQIEDDPNFSHFMLEEMIGEITRMINKYNTIHWASNPTAVRLVTLLLEQLQELQSELDDLTSGRRSLSVKDIYGPGERETHFGDITNMADGLLDMGNELDIE